MVASSDTAASAAARRESESIGVLGTLSLGLLLGALLSHDQLVAWVKIHPAIGAWMTVFIAVALQALPFLSAVVTDYLPDASYCRARVPGT